MAYKTGDLYTLYKLGIPLYNSSDLAAKKSYTPHSVTFTGQVRIVAVAWTDAQGNWYYPNQGAGTIPLYAISGDLSRGQTYTIGWIRSDDNYGLSRVLTTSRKLYTDHDEFVFNVTQAVPGSDFVFRFYDGDTLLHSGTSYDQTDKSVYRWRLTESDKSKLYNAIPNATEKQFQFDLETIINGRSLGKDYRLTTIYIETHARPAFTSGPTINQRDLINGKLYKDVSSVDLSVTAQAGRGATMQSLVATIGTQRQVNELSGRTSQSLNLSSGVFSTPGSVSITVQATDSRGRVTTWSRSVIVTDYLKPSFLTADVRRNVGDQTKAEVNASGQYDVAIAGTPMYAVDYKERSATSWRSTPARNVTTATNGYWAVLTDIPGFNVNSVYDFRIRVTDAMGYVVMATATLGTEAIPMHWGTHGSAFGRKFNKLNPANIQIGDGGLSIGDTLLTEEALQNLLNLIGAEGTVIPTPQPAPSDPPPVEYPPAPPPAEQEPIDIPTYLAWIDGQPLETMTVYFDGVAITNPSVSVGPNRNGADIWIKE